MEQIIPKGTFYGSISRKLDSSSFDFFEVEHSPNAYVPVHTHEIPHFMFVVKGTYNSDVRNKYIDCSPSTVLFHPAGVTHQDHFSSKGGKFLSIFLDEQKVEYLNDYKSQLQNHTLKFHESELSWLGTKILYELRFIDSLSPIVLEGMTNELLAYVIRQNKKEPRHPPSWLKIAYELINDKCAEPMTIAEIAETVGVHPLYLARTFKKFFYCSPGEYLRKRRIKKASELLINSDNTLVQIALKCGYSDQSQFTKSFKKHTSYTPGKYRQIYRK